LAFTVELFKEREDAESVTYAFRSAEASGFLTLEKRSGKIEGEGDPPSGQVQFAFERAARKLSLAHAQQQYPAKLVWQS
jgi:hypothetical protein